MSQRRITTILVLLLCGLSIALMALSRTNRNRGALELVYGNYYCSADGEDVWSSVMLDATGDVLPEIAWLYQSDTPLVPPAEHCAAKAAKMHEAAVASSCQTSGLATRVTEAGTESFFDFLCLGDREGAVAVMAILSGQLYETSP